MKAPAITAMDHSVKSIQVAKEITVAVPRRSKEVA